MLNKGKLLMDKDVIEEINRHKWLLSEVCGYDIGFDLAADGWIKEHAAAWLAARPDRRRNWA